MDEEQRRRRRLEARRLHNQEFLERLKARKPEAAARHAELLKTPPEEGAARRGAMEESAAVLRDVAGVQSDEFDLVLETIVRKERPVLFVEQDWLNTTEVTTLGQEAEELVASLQQHRQRLQPLMPLVGRIDVVNFPNTDFLGTAWFVTDDIVVTNRHVASLVAQRDGRRFAFSRGVGGRPIVPSLCTAHEFDDLAPDQARVFEVKEVLYIEGPAGPDIAFLKMKRRTSGAKPGYISVATSDAPADAPVLVVGYPARAPKSVIPDQALMKELYRDRFDVKRAAPGLAMSAERGSARHDCTTLGGNSGSVVLDPRTGTAVGLHYAGLYQEANYAVPASVLAKYLKDRPWLVPHAVEARGGDSSSTATGAPPRRPLHGAQAPAKAPVEQSASAGAHSATITIPLSITVTVGAPVAAPAPTGDSPQSPGGAPSVAPRAPGPTLDAANAAAGEFWTERPEGVIAVRVGFSEEGEAIGERPFIAASVPADQLEHVAANGPLQYRGVEVRYLPAEVGEQIEALPMVESVDSIAYDDNARKGEDYSFSAINEPMTVLAHVGPEYSWQELQGFLRHAEGALVSAMYEFHGAHIADAIEERLDNGASLELVLDNATFSKEQGAEEAFDRVERFESWADRFGARFKRMVAPEGMSGLVSDSYHIKVTVRDDDSFWLSSGNWKSSSSQPVITQEERDNAGETDLPGNREWHVIVKNKRLANRFRNHIRQDFRRSLELGGSELPKSREAAADIFIDVPLEETVVLERRPPSHLIEPQTFQGKIKVKPLLTPDREGAIYSEAVLELIESARHSLYFQIPYIGMPSNPREDRGYIDQLIAALTRKLKTLDDARVILRSGGSRYSSPTHSAWYFKSKGVDIQSRLRQIENHHTKGMIVDGERVLLGSHNWSKPGVTLNRDASLIFTSGDITRYYTDAFEVDWKRANPIKPKRFVKEEGVTPEAVGEAPPPGYRRVRLSELLKEDD